MQALLSLSRAIDRMNTAIGRAAMWLILAAVLVSAGNAVVRKALSTSSNAWLELQWYLFGAVFMLCGAYTLLNNEHIRIDIISQMLPKRVRNWIEIFGILFFLGPFCLIHIWHGIPFLIRSYDLQERSMNAGGLILWPAKSLVVIGFTLLLIQAVSELIKRVAVMRGLIPDPHEAPVEAEANLSQIH